MDSRGGDDERGVSPKARQFLEKRAGRLFVKTCVAPSSSVAPLAVLKVPEWLAPLFRFKVPALMFTVPAFVKVTVFELGIDPLLLSVSVPADCSTLEQLLSV